MAGMDLGNIDYSEYLKHERNLKQAVNSAVYADKNLQDLVIVGNNGYQYEFLSSFYTDITETEWFGAYVGNFLSPPRNNPYECWLSLLNIGSAPQYFRLNPWNTYGLQQEMTV